MKLEFAKRALDDIERKARKWREERDEKDLFEQELEEAFERIKNGPQTGQYYTTHRDRRVLRVLMRKTENHVYYRQDAPGVVRVLCAFGAHAAKADRSSAERRSVGHPETESGLKVNIMCLMRDNTGDSGATKRSLRSATTA